MEGNLTVLGKEFKLNFFVENQFLKKEKYFLGAGDEDSPFSDTSEDYVDPFADFETMDDDDEYETEDK